MQALSRRGRRGRGPNHWLSGDCILPSLNVCLRLHNLLPHVGETRSFHFLCSVANVVVVYEVGEVAVDGREANRRRGGETDGVVDLNGDWITHYAPLRHELIKKFPPRLGCDEEGEAARLKLEAYNSLPCYNRPPTLFVCVEEDDPRPWLGKGTVWLVLVNKEIDLRPDNCAYGIVR